MADLNQNQQSGFVRSINNQFFYIEVFLYNQLDNFKPLPLNTRFIDELSIEESLVTWVTRGYIVLQNDSEVLEKGALAAKDSTGASQDAIPSPYVFRTDGRNKISVRIKPLKSTSEIAGQTTSNSFPDDYEIYYDFVIYDVEDLHTDSSQIKRRKYYFWDEKYQILLERNIEYSTVYTANKSTDSKIPANVDYSKLPDSKKAAIANVAIKDILATTASNPPSIEKYVAGSDTNLKVGFDYPNKGGSIDKPKYPFEKIDDANWDVGSKESLVIYTSPANSNAAADLKYILDYCISSDGKSHTLLRYGRKTSDKTWKLIPISKYFETSKQNQKERMYIEDGIQNSKPYIPRAYSDDSTDLYNTTSPIASRIQSYYFVPMVAADDMRITNAPVHNFDFSNSGWNIFFKGNSVTDVKNELTNQGKKGLYNFSKGNPNSGQAQILLNQNKTKAQGYQLTNHTIFSTFFSKIASSLKMIKDALFLNQAVHLRLLGYTLRQPGTWIFIDRTSSGDKNAFDDRFLGQWLVTEVVHTFTQETYTNDIVAVKADAFSKLWDDKETHF